MKHNWAAAIKYLLQCRNMKAADLVRASGVPKSTISMILKGERTNPEWQTIEKIAEGLQVHIDVYIHAARGDFHLLLLCE